MGCLELISLVDTKDFLDRSSLITMGLHSPRLRPALLCWKLLLMLPYQSRIAALMLEAIVDYSEEMRSIACVEMETMFTGVFFTLVPFMSAVHLWLDGS